MELKVQHPGRDVRSRRRGRIVWLLTLALCGLSALWAYRLHGGPKKPAPTQHVAAASRPKPAFQIPPSWIQQLTPVAAPVKSRTRLRGTLLLEVLHQEGEALWTLPPELWKKAQRIPNTAAKGLSPGSGLHWPGAGQALIEQKDLVLDVADTSVSLLPPPEERCLVRWWLEGEPRAEAKGCDLDGGFAFDIEAVAGSRGWLEISYPGRLAVQLPVQVGDALVDLGRVALGYGFSASLRVTGSQGKALAGVRTALRHDGMAKDAPAFLGRTDAAGKMQWSTLPAGGATVELNLPGYRSQTIQIGAPRSEIVEARLEPVERLWGQVYLPAQIRNRGRTDQEYFEKVKVRLAGSGIWPPRVETCRDDGGFHFSEIPVGVYAIEAFVDDDELQLASYPLENVPSDHAVSLSLQPAFALLLELVDQKGAPVRGAKVSARSNALGLLARECVSDEVGFCRLPALVPSEYAVSVYAEGYLPLQQNLDRSLDLDGSRDEVLRWTLEKAPSCVARILDPKGQPLAMADVWVQRDRGDGPLKKNKEVVAVGVSDADGYVGFDPLAAGRYRLGARLDGWSAGMGLTFRPGKACERLQLTMKPAVRVVGTVLDDRGIDVAEASVELRSVSGQVLARTRSDAQGYFELEDARGNVQLVVRGTGYRPFVKALVLRRKDGESMEVPVILAVVQTGQLELGFVDQEGQPRPELQVEFSDPRGLQDKIFAVADRHGVVEIDRLPLGKWTVRVWCQGSLCLRRSMNWKRSEGVVQKKWTIADPWQLVLTVLDDVSEPVSGAALRLGELRALSDERGEAVFEPLWNDELSLRVKAQRFVTQKVQVKRPKEEVRREKTVTLERAGAIEGEVLDAWGAPIALAKVTLRWPHGEVSTQSGPQGRFSLRGVPQGDWELRVRAPADRPDLPEGRVPVNVRSQLTTRDIFVTLGEL